MDEVIQLGGNIDLVGFKDLERMEFEVIKKIVGNYGKEMSEKNTAFSKLAVNLVKDNDTCSITAEMNAGDASFKGEDSQSNLFMCLDSALRKIVDQL